MRYINFFFVRLDNLVFELMNFLLFNVYELFVIEIVWKWILIMINVVRVNSKIKIL